MAPDLISSLSLWQEPFMQRALIGGVISGILGGWVGSIAVLRQLSFFAEALGQASLLGISLALLLGLSPPVLLALCLGVCLAVCGNCSSAVHSRPMPCSA